MKVLSLFDGISCGMVALERAGIPVDRYVAYEVDKYAIEISKRNYPQIEQCGDVTKADFTQYKGFDLLIGGSPCQGFSRAGKELNFNDDRSKLFFEFVRAIKEAQPRFFLLENVKMRKEFQDVITQFLGVEPIEINSSLVSAQERKRLYWTNIPFDKHIEDKKIYLRDAIGIKRNTPGVDRIVMTKSDFDVKVRKHYVDKNKLSNFLRKYKETVHMSNGDISKMCGVPSTTVEHWFRTDNSFSIPPADIWETLKKTLNINDNTFDAAITEFEIKKNNYDMAKRIYHVDGKHPTLTTLSGGHQRKTITDGTDLFYLEPIHCERLQTLPDGYTEGVSNRQRFKALGNGWTVDVIAHIFKGLKIAW